MTYIQLDNHYQDWAQSIGAEPHGLDQAAPITLLIHTVEETKTSLTGEIYRTVSLYTDRLHLFIWAEKTVWRKDERGDTHEPVSEEFEVVLAT